ncbi:MAG: hypothetical protein HGA44_17140, partial [Cellulomonadaceae bacterium]|nr:hypothetical protein [Cellulomonadaceae bacterium]
MTADAALPPRTFAEHARGWGAGVVRSCLAARGLNDNARSVKSSIEEATGSYGGRFFVELLQNAHDAHPADSVGGKVLMLLDETEGPHGTVYAADAGSGFNEDNFRAISNLALSNKPVGEGIGNKGVGFKSVLQVCESPEVYSRDPDDPARDGFSFGFADQDQLRALAGSDDDYAWVLDNVSRYTVPVPVESVPPTARALRDEGFATVLRLPLRSAVAAEEADLRFKELGAGAVPMTLFLTRIASLELRRRDSAGTACRVLKRDAQPLALPLAGAGRPTAELATVEQGRTFLLLTREVDRGALMDALQESVRRERLKAKWLSWDAPAHVAVAVPYGWDGASDFRLYTFLPMGEDARSPLHGHLHAPFFTDYARKGLEWDHPLNAMLVDAAAALATDGAEALLASGRAGEHERRAAVDLVAWQPDGASHLPADVQERAVLPCLDGRAVPMSHARLWPDTEWDVLTAALAQRAAGLDVLIPGLGEDRRAR